MFNRGYNFYNGKRGWSFQIQTLVAMPVKSERAFFIAELEGLLRQMILEDDDKSTEFAEIMEIYEAVTGSRYLRLGCVVRSKYTSCDCHSCFSCYYFSYCYNCSIIYYFWLFTITIRTTNR